MPFVLWFSSAFSGVIAYFASFFAKKFSIVAAAIVSFTAILLTFKLAIDAILLGLQAVVPTGVILLGLQLLPDNTSQCISAIATGYVAAQVYNYWRNIIHFKIVSV